MSRSKVRATTRSLVATEKITGGWAGRPGVGAAATAIRGATVSTRSGGVGLVAACTLGGESASATATSSSAGATAASGPRWGGRRAVQAGRLTPSA